MSSCGRATFSGKSTQLTGDAADAVTVAGGDTRAMNTDDTRRTWVDTFLDFGIWVLFFALLIPAGVVGWVIGHS